MESGKKASLILWSGVAAAATGIIAVAAILKWKERAANEAGISDHLRGVQEILSECQQKIQEIESRLPVSPTQ